MKWFKPLLTAALAATLGLSLGACAGAQSQGATAEPAELSTSEKYRRAVNANAERKNVDVQWVNPPDDDDLEDDG